MKKSLLLFYLRVKSAFLSLSKILAATAAFSIIVTLIGFAGTKLLYSDDGMQPMDVALVLPDDSGMYTRAAFAFINEIDTVKSHCSFREMSETDAFDSLKSGNIDAIILVPDNFIEHILNGTNTPAEVILPKSGKTSSSPLFRELIKAGVGDLAIAQAGIYAVDDVCVRHGLRSEISKAELYLNEKYLSYALNRTVYFEKETVTSTGSLTLVQFYIRTAIVLLLMFSSISCMHLLCREGRCLNASFSRKGISTPVVLLSKTFGVSVMFFALSSVLILFCAIISGFSDRFTLILQQVSSGLGITEFILMFVAIFTTFSVAQTILGISDNISADVVLLFLLTLIMMFLSGALIPSAFLPSVIQKISIFMPTTWILNLWGNILSGTFDAVNVIVNIAVCCVCTALQALLVKINS
ncbi:MAG: ABC transporter permease [Bacteroides sp.]